MIVGYESTHVTKISSKEYLLAIDTMTSVVDRPLNARSLEIEQIDIHFLNKKEMYSCHSSQTQRIHMNGFLFGLS